MKINYITLGIVSGAMTGTLVGILVNDFSWLGAFIGAGAAVGTGAQIARRKKVFLKNSHVK